MHTKASNISKGDTLLYRIVDRGGAQWEGVTNIDETDLQNAKQRKESGCEYEDEPIVITVRYLMAQNKDGLCITYTDFFNCAFNLLQMPICGNQSKTLQSEIVRLSKELLQKDHIKINAKKFYPKAYMFDDKIQEPADKAQQRGFEITYYNNTPIYQTAYSKEAFESA